MQETIMDKSNTKKFLSDGVIFWLVVLALTVPQVREFIGKVAASVQETLTGVPSASRHRDEGAAPKRIEGAPPTDGERIFRENEEKLRSTHPSQPGPPVDRLGESWKIEGSLIPPRHTSGALRPTPPRDLGAPLVPSRPLTPDRPSSSGGPGTGLRGREGSFSRTSHFILHEGRGPLSFDMRGEPAGARGPRLSGLAHEARQASIPVQLSDD
jgi:hypothetical protein